MNRRYFLGLVSSGLLVPEMLTAKHHVISADPLEVESDLNSLPGRYTPVSDFYVRNHHDVPADEVKPVLRIAGEVEQPRDVAPADLAFLDQREVGAVLECAGNRVGSSGLISNGYWSGWRLRDVLALARPTSRAAHLHLLGRDGYERSVPLERANTDGILVTRLNGRPLTRQHGAPWRALFLGWFGMDSVKWLERLSLARDPLPPEGNTYQEIRQTPSGELERRPLPRLPVKAVIIDPLEGAVLRRGAEIRGLAWSGTGKIASVEVSPDGGSTWQAAELQPGRDFEWWLWKKADLEFARTGATELVARARDAEGLQQPATRDPSRLDGYVNNWYHRVRCVVV